MQRVVVFVDGFNLYHALLKLPGNQAKWLDLNKLSQRLIRPVSERLVRVYYFSAYATWLAASAARHREYVRALQATGVVAVMGHFKSKLARCHSCGNSWEAHEEKETDVNIALYMLRAAYLDEFDVALLISRDSDLVPAAAMVLEAFPEKQVISVSPPLLRHSTDLLRVCSARRKITVDQVEESLLPAEVRAETGTILATRPPAYD